MAFCTVEVSAQQPAYFFLGAEQFDGVHIYDVIQDLESNYWFATDQGIFKHDGYAYELLTCIDMAGPSAFGFVMNRNGTLYCHNLNYQIIQIQAGICSVLYELREDERSSDLHLRITAENALLVVGKKALLIDEKGTVTRNPLPRLHYFGVPFQTRDHKLICHMGSSDSILQVAGGSFRYLSLRGEKLAKDAVLRFFSIRDTSYAIDMSRKTLYRFDETRYSLTALDPKSFLLPNKHLRCYNENDQLWMADPIAGVSVLNDPLGQTTAQLWYPEFLISDVYQDREGNLLLSTFDQGVIVVPDLEIQDVMRIPGDRRVVGLQLDDDLGILFGTTDGRLLAFRDTAFIQLNTQGTKPLESIFSWPDHSLVLYDDGNIKVHNKTTGTTHVLATGSLKDAIAIDAHTLYLALNMGIRKVIWDGKQGFAEENVRGLEMRSYAIAYDSISKDIYVATSDGLKLLRPDGSVHRKDFQGERIIASDLAFANGVLHIAAKQQGILALKNGSSMRSFHAEGLGQTTEFSQFAVGKNHVFVSTTAGIVRISSDGKTPLLYRIAKQFGTHRIFDFELDGDKLWLAHAKGVQRLQMNPASRPLPRPQVRIAAILVNDLPVQAQTSSGAFASGQRKFRFQLAAPTLRYRENLQYHYQLLGYEEGWSTAPYTENSVTYNALGAGEYTFRVKAENQGRASEVVAYAFSISSPLYARWWFIFLGIVLLLTITLLIYRRQVGIQRRKERLLNELNASKLTAIQSQMNPHFIFNALNSIQDLVLKGDVENSYSYITTFSNLVRRTLNSSDKDFIDFEQEIKLLELYLSLEKLRFKQDLEYEVVYEHIEDDIQLPPLLIQPFVENALVHGLLHREGEKRLIVQFEFGETLMCIIEDNGIGRERSRAIKERQRSDHESFSGKAIRKRFDILSEVFQGEFGYQYEDLMEDGKAVGTRVTLRIPVKRRF